MMTPHTFRTFMLAGVLPLLHAATCLATDLSLADQQRLYRRLDRLQALGVGLLNQQVPSPPGTADQDAGSRLPSPLGLTDEGYRQQLERHNEQTGAKLSQHLAEIKSQCGGKLPDYPEVGMSDEAFRLCTIHARYGGARQIVVSEAGGVPLRLYVFSSVRAHKVYTMGGVVTRIEP